MDAAPIWTDLKSFPWAEFRDRVDILTGGYPCQPFSAAGKRLGTEDPRHLWPFIADGIRLLRPRLCYFENVEGHISLGLREVVGELEQIGYSTAWGIFSASEVGAPHQRKRVFILAYDKSQRIQGHWADWLQESRPHAGQGLPLRGGDAGCGELANASDGSNPAHGYAEAHRLPSKHWQEVCSGVAGGANATAWPSRPGEPQHGWEPPRVVDSTSARQQAQRDESNGKRQEGFACESSELGNAAHWSNGQQPTKQQGRDSARGSSEAGAMGNADHGRLASGLNAGSCTEADRGGQGDIEQAEPWQTQPSLGGDPHGPAGGLDYAELQVSCDNRTDELRLLGNGVVPATADRAFRILIEELFTMEGQE